MTGPETPLPTLIKKSDHLAILRHIRAHKLPNSSPLVVKHGQSLLQSKSWNSSLTEIERIACLEQICIAALQEQNKELAKETLKTIHQQVSSSSSISLRYRKLIALSLENDEDYETAMEFYKKMLQENPSNSHAFKRKYCVLKSQGKSQEAREVLNSYLEENGTDVGAWVEMANSCLEIGDYKGAAYCYEEIVLSSPLDSNVHCLLGEMYVTIGGIDNLKLARKHMALSLELNPDNLRAIYGIVSAAETYLQLVDKSESSSKSNDKKKKFDKNSFDEEDVEMAKDLYKYGVGKLSNVYKGTSLSPILGMILDSEE
jgi:tetratricopeptide (TPR) repeat protein